MCLMTQVKVLSIVVCYMHYNWTQHIILARTVASLGPDEQGRGLALMGIALLILATDLEQDISVCEAKEIPSSSER